MTPILTLEYDRTSRIPSTPRRVWKILCRRRSRFAPSAATSIPAATEWREALKVFRTKDDVLDLEAVRSCLKENDIEAPKVDMDRHGAIDRFQMWAGLMLRKVAKKNGFVVIDGKNIAALAAKKRKRKAKDGRSGKLDPALFLIP